MQDKEVIEFTKSISGKEIRLTFKQWFHIIESHDYMGGNIEKVMETISSPDYIIKGIKGELIAIKHYHNTNIGEKCCVVVYKEEEKEGFIITAFFTSKPETIRKGGVVWQKQKLE